MDLTPDRGLTFGSVAERYERYRPGYPPEAIDLLLAESPATAIEVGAGTGKATRAVAGRGVPVTAVEPDPDMARVLERVTAGMSVTVVGATFEELPPQPPTDLLYAAAAFHWTAPATRWERAAALLRPGGVFACLAGPLDVEDERLADRVARVRQEVFADEHTSRACDGQDGARWPIPELTASPWFDDVREFDFTSTFSMPADDLVGMMSTVSAFLVQPVEIRDRLLDRIRRVLPDPVSVRRDLTVHLARRV